MLGTSEAGERLLANQLALVVRSNPRLALTDLAIALASAADVTVDLAAQFISRIDSLDLSSEPALDPDSRGSPAETILAVNTSNLETVRNRLADFETLALHSPHSEVRAAAVLAVGLYGADPRAANLILHALEDEDPIVRAYAVKTAALHYDELPEIRDEVRRLLEYETEITPRHYAILRLGMDRDYHPRTVNVLVKLAVERDTDESLRLAAINALETCGEGYARVVPILTRIGVDAKEPKEIQKRAMEVVCSLLRASDLGPLIETLAETGGHLASRLADKLLVKQMANIQRVFPDFRGRLIECAQSAPESVAATTILILSILDTDDGAIQGEDTLDIPQRIPQAKEVRIVSQIERHPLLDSPERTSDGASGTREKAPHVIELLRAREGYHG